MGYVLNRDTIKWARIREQQIREAEPELGAVMEKLEYLPKDIRCGVILIEDQPESSVMESFADDLEKLYTDYKKRFEAMIKDGNALGAAIRKYERGHNDDS